MSSGPKGLSASSSSLTTTNNNILIIKQCSFNRKKRKFLQEQSPNNNNNYNNNNKSNNIKQQKNLKFNKDKNDAECEDGEKKSFPKRKKSTYSNKHKNNNNYDSLLLNRITKTGNLLLFRCVFILFLIDIYFVNFSHQQSSISLNTAQWFVSNANNSIFVPAQVPGGVYSDLRRNSILKQDILYGKNDVAYRWVGNENWTYSTTFTIDDQLARSQSVKLVLHGVDTISTLSLNGQEIGTTENMFVRYKFDIKPHLKLAGMPNTLVVKFESPVKYSNRKSHQSIRQNRGKIIPPYCPSPAQRGECHVNFIRKMQASFSWDWGPAFPSMGIYKDIEIEFGSFGIIRDILVETRRIPSLIPPVDSNTRRQGIPNPPVIISSSIRQQVRRPMLNSTRTLPYIRSPPYFVPSLLNQHNPNQQESLGERSDGPPAHIHLNDYSPSSTHQQLSEESWLLKTTLVAEMVQPSFGYNVRIEFNLNGVLHYESEHINVIANQEGTIRLGFNLKIDPSRMRVQTWWPNNAGTQPLYKLTARMMPIPASSQTISPDRVGRRFGDSVIQTARRRFTRLPQTGAAQQPSAVDDQQNYSLQFRSKPLQTPAITPGMVFLATHAESSNMYQMQHVSEKQITFGFRTVELIQEPIVPTNGSDDGLSFLFRVNGVDLFAMGSNWIPSSVLPEQSNDIEYVRYLLQSAKDANMNMLRVWGGGIYESDAFYQLADQMGIMIWHDFMFACALYPSEDDFLASVRVEIEQQVQRLQHHPSIVLWAGNNENEMAIAGPWWPEVMAWNKKLRENYSTLYVDTIKPIVGILDSTRPYVESSPSNGLLSQSQPYSIARVPNDNKYGDVHHYDYLADSFDWSNYPSTRFASEYGFQSYPSFSSLASVTTPNDWKYPLSSNILHRQHRLTGETEIRLQIRLHFNEPQIGGPDKLKSFIYTSQLTQAIAIKTETEFYRRNRFIDPETKLGKTMGALYWQLNDVWQAPTWSSIEYGGRWKMLHYFARRFFFPIQVMPYLTQPSWGFTNGVLQQLSGITNGAGSSLLMNNNNAGLSLLNSFSGGPNFSRQHGAQSNDQQQQANPSFFAIDLVRDDLFYLLDSFNVTMKFFRWTSFAPIWQETIYVRNTRPQNVTRIYEQDLARILRNQPGGGISPSSGVFQVVIEAQPELGLSEIDNYLLPLVAPSKITAMRVAKISVEIIQGPFQLANSPQEKDSLSSSSQWACVYRLVLVSDSIAMFVWLDLNSMNMSNAQSSNPPASNLVPEQIRINGLPPQFQAPQASSNGAFGTSGDFPNVAAQSMPPEHIRLHLSDPRASTSHHEHSPPPHHHLFSDDSTRANIQRVSRQLRTAEDPLQQPSGSVQPIREQVPGVEGAQALDERLQQQQQAELAARAQRVKLNAMNKQNGEQQSTGNTSAGSFNYRFQFSDNAFNMFEPSKVIDLYLSKCLSKGQIESMLEIQSLAANL